MEIRAYHENYLDDAQATMGNMMDYAINGCKIDGDEFFHMFLASGIAAQIEHGNPKYIAGMSSADIVKEIVLHQKEVKINEPEEYYLDKSPEYWCGWILAYYQWKTCRSFKKIYQIITISNLLNMYPTHHEADEEHFVDTLNQLFEKQHSETYLYQKMYTLGLTVKTVAEQTGIPCTTIEQLSRDFSKINEITAFELFKLSLVFGCTMEDLMEIPNRNN